MQITSGLSTAVDRKGMQSSISHKAFFKGMNPENGIYADKQMSLYKKRFTDCIAALG